MSDAPLFDLALAGLILAVGAWSTAARGPFAAVTAFVVYGQLLALAWLRLAAPDVALAEAAIGGGLTGMLLLGALARLRGDGARSDPPPGPGLRLATAGLCAMLAAAIGAAFLALPEPAPTLAPEAASRLPATGVGNPVTAVLMAYRATDTLLEKLVLLLAVLGVWSLAPDRCFGGRPGQRERAADGALSLLARVLPPFGVVAGVYVLWVSADEPGGAFQAGTLLAATWLLVVMAGLADAPATRGRRLRLALVAGPAVFLAAGCAGIALAGAFLGYPERFAKALILAIEFPMTLSVAAMLGLLLLGAPRRSDRA